MNLSLFDMRIHFRALRALCAAFALLATGTVAAQSVTITAPANGASYTLGNTVNLTATKSGGNKVRFKQNGTVISTDNSPPFAASFTPGSTGSYALTAELLNFSDSVIATSATVNITVGSGGGGGGTVSATRRYVYDGYERLCKVIEPERGATIIDYDAADNIAWTAEGTNLTNLTDCQRDSVTAGQKVTRTYDAMNRVTAVATPDGKADVTTTYYADGLVNTLTAANPGGNNVTTTYTYNKRRLLTGESSTNGASVMTLGYGYNANGHLGALTYPDGRIVSYAPDALGRATAVTDNESRTYASNITYFAGGAIKQFDYGNGITHTMGKNTRQLPTTSQDWYCPSAPNTPSCSGKTYVLNDTYAFDANGNVDAVTDALAATSTNRSRDLGYDGLDRLIVADAANQWGTATFAYDALDNLKSADVGARQYRYNYDANNLLLNIKNPAGTTQFAFTYDTRGNTLAKTGQAFVFDYANRLNEVTGSQVYRYDGQGRRVQTTDVADGKTTFWIYSQSGQVLYTSEARRNQNISYIYLGNTQLATKTVAWAPVSTTTIAYQHTDSLGSIVAESNASKTVTKRNSYEPYGGAWNSTIDGTGYTGHVMDQATGLTYMQQRYYDPQVGRFLSTDPMASDMNNAWNFNRYNYAGNNPYKFTDPDGRSLADRKYIFGIHTYTNPDRSKNSGHAWVSIRQVGSGTTTTYGAWRDGLQPVGGGARIPNNGAASDVRINEEAAHGYAKSTQSAFFIIDSAQASSLREYVSSTDFQFSAVTNNCADLAMGALDAATGIDLPGGLINSPSSLSSQIDGLNTFSDVLIDGGTESAISESKQRKVIEAINKLDE